MSDPTIRSSPELVLAHLDVLPTLAPVAVRVLQIVVDARSGASELGEVVRADPSLSALLLSVARSAGRGGARDIRTVEQAVVFLGYRAVCGLVLAAKVVSCFPPTTGPRAFQRVEFWKHCIAAACVARRLARAQKDVSVDPEDAFLAGLLHDLGKIALDAVFPKTYERIASAAARSRRELADCERAALGVDHMTAGRRIAERWNLPRRVQETIWLHHVGPEGIPSSAESPRLIALVHLANAVAREQRLGDSANHAPCESAESIALRVGVGAESLASAIDGLAAEVADYATLLGLDAETAESLYARSVARANEELGRLNRELSATNERLATAERFFRAVTSLDAALRPGFELGDAVRAIADAVRDGLGLGGSLTFAVDRRARVIEVVRRNARGMPESSTAPLHDELALWCDGFSRRRSTGIQPLSAELRAALCVCCEIGDLSWLLPIVHDGELLGGVVDGDGAASRELPDGAELQSFVATLGQTLGQAAAHSAARRLADDLADSNRRFHAMQAEVLRARALAMIAEMAAGAAHELNNPLSVISGRAQMLQKRIGDEDATLSQGLAQIAGKAHECSKIVSDLMEFARPQPPQRTDVDPDELLSEAIGDFAAESSLPASRIAHRGSSGARGVRLLVDRGQLRTVLLDVLRNAAEAVSENAGAISVTWESIPQDRLSESDRERLGASGGAGAVRISVRDTGRGMPANVLSRVFDPFFSHRPAGRGRGLGLPRAYRTVDAHGGRMWLESAVDKGTVVHLLLPAARG